MKSTVVISRHWDKPQINVFVTVAGIQIETAIDDYLTALAAEIGNPTMLVTRRAMIEALRSASLTAIEKIKEASSHA